MFHAVYGMSSSDAWTEANKFVKKYDVDYENFSVYTDCENEPWYLPFLKDYNIDCDADLTPEEEKECYK